jgi:hypothetical protein
MTPARPDPLYVWTLSRDWLTLSRAGTGMVAALHPRAGGTWDYLVVKSGAAGDTVAGSSASLAEGVGVVWRTLLRPRA